MSLREEYLRRMKAQIAVLNDQIDRQIAQARLAKADLQLARHKQQLETHRQKVSDQLQQIEQAGEDAWKHLKIGLDSAMAELRSAADKARSEFKKAS